MEEEAVAVATRAAELVRELQEEEDDESAGGLEDFRAAQKEAERSIAQGTAAQALQAAMIAVGALLSSTNFKASQLVARISEIMWLAKDAAAAAEDMGDARGRALALMTLARAHLLRAQEPDAPSAAVKSVKDAVAISESLHERTTEAEAQLLLGEAHLAKASATPFEKVLVEQIGLVVEATSRAEELFEAAGDRRSQAKALHCRAKALLRHTDEDEVLEGECIADRARELFHELGDHASEVAVLLTALAGRHATSGPESALMMARDALEDWQQEGGRPRDVALASVLAAGFQLELGEMDDSLRLCADALSLYDRSGARRGVASALEARAATLFAMQRHGEALNALEEMASVFEKIGDKRSQGGALMMAASILLSKLSEEVETDTQAEFEKREPSVGISMEEVQKRSTDGLEFANRAAVCFEQAGAEEEQQAVADLIQVTYNKAIQIYCATNEPDRIYYTLSKDSPIEDSSKCIKEWKIPMPAWSKGEGGYDGDGFLHVFDPHPPATA